MILVLDFFDFITDLNDLNQSILTRNSWTLMQSFLHLCNIPLCK